MERNYSKLVFNKAYVNGEWIDANSGKTFAVFNPANGKEIGSVPDMNAEDTEKAIQSAKIAFQSWKKKTARERSIILRRWYDLVVENSSQLAELLTAENGKSLAESKGEIGYASSFIEWFAEEAKRLNGDVFQSPVSSKRYMAIKQPIGVSGMITPWNFPSAMITRKAAPAIAVGCTVVIRPAEDTPFSALALCKLAEEAGIPRGVLNVVTSSRDRASEIGKVLCTHPDVMAISFTGSTQVGKILLEQSASTVKRVSLELGGNAPFIVFESANLDKAIGGAMACKFRTTGQACISSNRFLVHENIYNEFVERMTEKMKTLKVGHGTDSTANQGPLINDRAVKKINNLVNDATSKGASVKIGGSRHQLGGNFYEPTLITDITEKMDIASAEIFGPVAAIYKFKTEEEAVRIANSTRYGLAGYFFSEDIGQIFRVAEDLEVGMVGINEGVFSCCEAPFGGVKESGLGREGSKYGLDEFCEIKQLCFGNV